MSELIWETSWKNYMLYLGAIQSENEPVKPKEKLPEIDAADAF